MVESAAAEIASLKVLNVAASSKGAMGGPVSVVQAMRTALAENGIEAELFETGESDRLFRMRRRLGFVWGGSTVVRLCREARSSNVLHIHGLWHMPALMAARIARLYGLPYVVSTHGMMTRWSLCQKARRKRVYWAVSGRKLLTQADLVHVVTREEQLVLEAVCPETTTLYMENGLSVREMEHVFSERQMQNQKDGSLHVLYLGRIAPGKGVDTLLDAVVALVSWGVGVEARVVGPVSEATRLSGQVQRLVRDRTVANGSVKYEGALYGQERDELFVWADVFVLASAHEADSMAIKEALAAGVPVLVTKECRAGGAVAAGAGLLTERDAEHLARVMRSLADDPAGLQEMGRRARAYAVDRFDARDRARTLAAEYRRVVDEQGRAGQAWSKMRSVSRRSEAPASRLW